MQEQPQAKGWTPIQDAKQAANVMMFAAQALASPVEVILRTRFGSRYFGMASLVGLFAVPMWMLFWPGESPVGLTWFWLFYLVMQLRARVESLRMVMKGDIVHTRSNGCPRLARYFKRTSERNIKGGVEPAAVFLAGALLSGVSPPLGSYLMTAAVCLWITHSAILAVERARAFDLHDSFLEQQDLVERYRAIGGKQRR
ncbi:MAG: hypothetical protein IT431_15455 [Phycisphaerales bacterium]|nr:hypothetical protein [Phycisphaerales bacterium]